MDMWSEVGVRFGGPGPPGGAGDGFPGRPPPPAGAEWWPVRHHVRWTGPLHLGPAHRPPARVGLSAEAIRGAPTPGLPGAWQRGARPQPGQLCPNQLHNGSGPPAGATLVWGRRAGAGWPSRAHGPVLTWPGHRRLPWGPRRQGGGAGVHSALCEHPGVETGSAGAAAVSGCRQGVRLGRCPRGAARPPVCTVSVLPQGDGQPARRPVPGRAPQSLGGGGARAHFLSVVSDLTVWLRGDAGETAAAPRDRLLGSVDGVLGGDEPPLRAPGGPAACLA